MTAGFFDGKLFDKLDESPTVASSTFLIPNFLCPFLLKSQFLIYHKDLLNAAN